MLATILYGLDSLAEIYLVQGSVAPHLPVTADISLTATWADEGMVLLSAHSLFNFLLASIFQKYATS